MTTIDDQLNQTQGLHVLLDKPAFQKQVPGQDSVPLPLTKCQTWQHANRGQIKSASSKIVQLLGPTRYESWPAGSPADGDYIQFGHITAKLPIAREDWTAYNQLSFTAKASCENVINPNFTLAFKNDGKVKIPDVYLRDGFHSVDLINGQSQIITLNINDLPRDAITEISIDTAANGSYLNLPGKIDLTFSDFTLAKISQAPVTHGWLPNPGRIVVAEAGYPADAKKIALLTPNGAQVFEIHDADSNQVICQGSLVKKSVQNKQLLEADFSAFKVPGHYYLTSEKARSADFIIKEASAVYSQSALAALNFIYSQRCGAPVFGLHGTCHSDVFAVHNGQEVAFNGGWHDAGDLSQQTVQTGEVAWGLLQAASAYRATDAQFAQRLEEEAFWGLDFVLKTRFGDGYRATSAGTSRWTDNRLHNFDDVKARVHDTPYENYLFAGLEADCARLTADAVWQKRLLQVAASDFEFAQAEFAQKPYAPEPIMWEHTYNLSHATYDATIAFAAASLFTATGKAAYKQIALTYGQKLLQAQEQTGIKLDDGTLLKGMFYRDTSHEVFQHFNHQAREHLFGMALHALLAITQNDVQAQRTYQQAARNYADYLLWLRQFTAPYPMIASGIYKDDENKDTDSFYLQHLLIDQSAEKEYPKQLQGGIQVAPHYFVKRFPVWFSFRGNNGVILSTALSAASLAACLHDDALKQLAFDQLNWICGLNPFDQSLMSGVGSHFEPLYAASCGQQTGALPVGVETAGDEDTPYWPAFNNATYKEVWIANDGKWLALLGLLLPHRKD